MLQGRKTPTTNQPKYVYLYETANVGLLAVNQTTLISRDLTQVRHDIDGMFVSLDSSFMHT